MQTIEEGEDADYCIVNTCSVTALADKKCRQAIRHLHRQYPNARIIVTGCYAQLSPDEIFDIEGVDLVIGAAEKDRLLSYIIRMEEGASFGHPIHSEIKDATTFIPSVSSEGRTRHFLKVQDGCNYKCSYCTIPLARGVSRNGSIKELVALAQDVAKSGGKEIVLTGVNVGDFGRSTGESFIELLQALDNIDGIDRFRISSIEPNLITHGIIDFVANSTHFAPHFHIPLQSGSNEVLRLMHRRYNRELFREKVEHIHQVMPSAFIGVDVIVGMRGEKPEYFDDGYDFLDSISVSKLHVFPYSERPNTDALMIDYVVSPEEKQERTQRLISLSSDKLNAFNMSQVGTKHRVLVEHSETAISLYGFTDNYIRVKLPYDESLQGEIVSVKVGLPAKNDPEVMEGKLIH